MHNEVVNSRRKFQNFYHSIDNLKDLLDFFKKYYQLREIYATPNIILTESEILKTVTGQKIIEIKTWEFVNLEVLPFEGYMFDYFEKFKQLLERFQNNEETTSNDKIEQIDEFIKMAEELRNHHNAETRFSLIVDFTTLVKAKEGKSIEIPLICTSYISNGGIVNNEFQIRSEFFHELALRMKQVQNELFEDFRSEVLIQPKSKVAKYLVYELVAVLKKSDYFVFTASETEKLEQELFKLLNIKTPEKRSKEIGHLNANKDKILHLRGIVSDYPPELKIR